METNASFASFQTGNAALSPHQSCPVSQSSFYVFPLYGRVISLGLRLCLSLRRGNAQFKALPYKGCSPETTSSLTVRLNLSTVISLIDPYADQTAYASGLFGERPDPCRCYMGATPQIRRLILRCIYACTGRTG
jgi:hypothetical protein